MAQNSNDTAVVGVFDDYRTAERVALELTNIGIPREAIDVKSNFMTGAAGRSTEEHEQHEGGISGFFHRLFGGEDDSDHYAESVRRGNAVVSVMAPPEQIDQAVEIMNSAGAVDINQHVERYRQTGYEKHDPNAPAYSYDEAAEERARFSGKEGERTIPVVEEEMQVGKRAVQRGGVRVYSRVVEEPVEERVELTEERARVERRPVNRPADAGDLRMRDQSVEVTETAEEPVIQKRARVREEVVVGKERTSHTEQVKDTVRRTEVNVEKMAGSGPVQYSDDFRRDWQDRYASSGGTYDAYAPAYDYGYRSANDSRWRGKNWSDVENDLRTDYERQYPDSTWDRMKGAVRYGWEKVTGKR